MRAKTIEELLNDPALPEGEREALEEIYSNKD